MPVFGGYETVGQLSPTPFGSVYKAKQAGGSAANFIIKTFSPLGVDAAELKRHPDVKKFLGSAELQKLVAGSSKHWAPVHEMGISNEGAYYVSTFYPTSASRLIKGKTKLGSDDFYELTQSILAGLVELRECCRRSHGNLLPNAILLPRMDATGYGQAMLAEPLAADSTKAASEQGDLAALGRVLYELVMHKPYNVAGAWPIPESPEWARMGRAGKGWREFCNKLLSTDPADAMTLQSAQAELSKLKPKKAPVPIWAVVAAVLVLAIGGGVFSYFHFRPDPNFKDKWVQLVDAYPAWFRLFADENLRNQLPAEYASARDLVDKAQKQKHLELDPRDLSGKRDIDEQKGNPPATRDGMSKAKDAFELAKAVQTQIMTGIGATAPEELDAKKLPEALVAKVEGYAKEYEKRGWSAPAQQLAKLTKATAGESGGEYINRLLGLLQELPELKAIEGDWAVVEARQKQITDPSDPILRQFPDFVRRAVYADADRDNVITTKDIAQKLKNLRSDFDKDPAFWNELGQFVSGRWKNEIDKDALRKTNLYVTPPTQLLETHLRNWLAEAEQYGMLAAQDNPAKKPDFEGLTKNVKEQFAALMSYYNGKQQTPPQDVMKVQENLTKTDADVTRLRNLPWRSGTKPDVESGVADATRRLNELADQIDRAIKDTQRTDPATIDTLVQQLKKRTFDSPVTKTRWDELKRKWALENVENLRKALTEPEKFKRFKDSTRIAEDNLHTMEKALSDRLELSGVQRKSVWNRALVDVMKRLDEAQQRRLLQLAVDTMDLDRLMTVSANLENEMNKFRDLYDGWRKEARHFVETANSLEDHLDAGYGLLSEASAKSPVAALYQELMGSSFSKIGEVASAVAPLLAERFETLKSLRSESRPAMLMEIVRKNQYPSMVLDAWERLHSADVNWPTTAEQLDFEREHRKSLSGAVGSRISSDQVAELVKRRQESLQAELRQQGPPTWRRFMVSARGAGEVEAALKRGLDADLMNDFGVSDLAKVDPPLPAQVQFDIFLFTNRPKVLALAEKLDDKKAKDVVDSLLKSLPAGDGADALTGKIRAGLVELMKDQGGGGGAVVDAGPMSKAIQERMHWERRGTPEQPSFSWNGHVLTFVRLEGAEDGNRKKLAPYYLCTTEMTMGLFQALMGSVGTATDLNLPKGDRNMSGPQLWERAGEALKPRDNWMRIHTQIFNDFAPSLSKSKLLLGQVDANPMETMPMQNVPPEAALAIAEAMGCRLPSSFEWEFAVKRPAIGPQPLPNLRDASWDAQLKHITGVVDDGNIFAQYPDNGMFPYEGKYGRGKDAVIWSAQWQQQFNLNLPGGYNDGYVYLRPVGDGSTLSDLIGNVSEMVFDAPAKLLKVEPTVPKLREVLEANQDQLFVVGGSCISPPEVGFAKQPCGMHGGYADTGFRVAFEAANRLIVDRLKDLMNDQDYIAMAVAAPAPAN